MAYKFNFILMVIAPVLVFYLVKYNIWSSIYALNDLSIIKNYTLQEMLNYQAWSMVVAFLGLAYINSKVSEDIRMGRISAFLLYPFDFWKFHTGSFLGFQLTQLTICLFTVFALLMSGLVEWASWIPLLQGIVISLEVGVLWFILMFSIALLSFWMEETWVLRVMLITISQFLSGSIIPIDLYPQWLQSILAYTPFPYLTFVPIKIFMGQGEYGFLSSFFIILFWIIIAFFMLKVIWNKGVKLYTAAGI